MLGKKMLVPLTASLYVPGKLDDADKVLVDVGTGYFIEVSWWIFVLVAVDSVLIFCEIWFTRNWISLGTGLVYKLFVTEKMRKTMAEGKDYCERKINLLRSNYDQLVEVATKKKSIADEAGVILQAKLKQLGAAT
ncbi:putative prefoldin subunit 5 [Vitis vinifera]|uniref:Putative prefoldin subunit 5 n=1 Tax=Vitis vinifera TaxID=29760 RepID=A0A438EUM5_VITVI|nr:putative prefoldin subunit 5 [Vitis vinifera]